MLQYPFTANYAPATVDPSVQSLSLDTSLLNPGCVCNDGFGTVFQSYPSNGSTTAVAALSNGSYFSIALSLQPGYLLDASSLTFDVGKGGNSDPRGYFIRASVDGYSSNLTAATLPSGAQQAPQFASVDLSGAQFQGLSSLGLRFYVWTPSPTGNSVDWSNITLNGATATPEPSTILLLAGGIGALIAAQKRLRPLR